MWMPTPAHTESSQFPVHLSPPLPLGVCDNALYTIFQIISCWLYFLVLQITLFTKASPPSCFMQFSTDALESHQLIIASDTKAVLYKINQFFIKVYLILTCFIFYYGSACWGKENPTIFNYRYTFHWYHFNCSLPLLSLMSRAFSFLINSICVNHLWENNIHLGNIREESFMYVIVLS